MLRVTRAFIHTNCASLDNSFSLKVKKIKKKNFLNASKKNE